MSTLLKLYRRFADNRLFSTIVFILYNSTQTIKHLFKDDKVLINEVKSQPLIGLICDEMTWVNFKGNYHVVYLTPYNWKKILKEYPVEQIFCEATWSGINEMKKIWHTKVYKNHRLLVNNTRALDKLLVYAHSKDIKTIFWNKEDPTFFNSPRYDFSFTASKFDKIYTTDIDCLAKYQEFYQKEAMYLPFLFSKDIFYPNEAIIKIEQAVFAGGWYQDLKQRCIDMELVFDYVLNELKIPLVIYDRYYGSNDANHQYPSKYQQYLKPNITYQETALAYQKSMYAININSVTNSSSMFARRVIEIMACKTLVISNYSQALQNIFPNKIIYPNKPLELVKYDDIINENYQYVSKHYCLENTNIFND